MRRILWRTLLGPFFAVSFVGAMSSAHAGRPLTVDDANVNDTGAGHVEAWWAKGPAGERAWTVAPAYAPWDGIELSAALARQSGVEGGRAVSLQAKVQFSAPKPNTCHTAGVVGATSARQGSPRERLDTPYLVGILTCSISDEALHLNVGLTGASSSSRVASVGVAWEHDLGPVVLHAEALAQQRGKPTWGVGARHLVLSNFQIDGTLSRTNGVTFYSAGVKWQF
jgi:hypothetical protein